MPFKLRILVGSACFVILSLMKTGLFPVRVTGRHHLQGVSDKGLVLAANHESALDAVFMTVLTRRTVTFMCLQRVLDRPGFGRLYKRLGFLPVEPGNQALNVRSLARCRRLLRSGGTLGIFPAGGYDTVVGEQIAPFEPGAARLAIQAQSPLLPVGIRGARRLMPLYVDGQQTFRNWLVLPFRRVHVAFGEPIYPTADGLPGGPPLTGADAKVLTGVLQDRVAQLARLESPAAA
jgi:1-acyl-sn-glycerol-3-phosphate acyltransferase